MGDVKDLSNQPANEKVQDLAEDIDICMFCTFKGDEMISRPMSTQQVDDDGVVWFMSDKDSNKNNEIKQNNKVDLLYAKGYSTFLSLKGEAEIVFDVEKVKQLWTPHVKVWFTEGPEDPRISLIKVTYKSGHYWDTKHGRMVQMAKMAASLLTGKTMDDGITGEISR